MSKADNNELEHAIKVLMDYKNNKKEMMKETLCKAIETVLNHIDNSISKEVILDKIRERQFELQQEYIDFKDDIKLNTLQELLEGK